MVPLPSVTSYRHRISLDGQWSFALDPEDTGSQESWYSDRKFDASIQIPGSWEEQGYGFAPHSNPLWGWNKTHEYEGAAWYQRTVEIPSEWDGKAIELILTGVRWRSRVWIDDEYTGEQERLSVPHRYDLTEFIKPGSQHRLSIQIDNRMLYSLPESHINSLQTATRWGGITGGILLEARSKNAIQHIRCYPNVTERSFDFEVTAAIADATFEVSITNPQNGEKVTGITTLKGGSGSVSVKPGSDAPLWWDDAPFLYHAQFILRDGETILDGLEKRVGLREISVDGKQILLNGKPVFLRGYVDCCIFPLTGYPAQDIEQYRHQFKVARRHGFNHVRLHSWTAPQPFWDAADEIGMLVQTELPNWSRVYDYREIPPPSDLHRFLMHELEAIIQEYHFHPSWVMFSNGNELAGNWDGHPDLIELTARGKELDPTRLYTDQTGFGQIPAPSRPVDYYIQSCNWHPPKKIYDAATDNTAEDFSAVTALSDRPVIGHEHGQFTMYVRPSEAEKYTGVIRPAWLESIQETFEAKGMTSRVDDYIAASGIHILRTYKENIERARRTHALAGIQLLDIRDFPGQGHATTGILDMFWDSKGLIEPEDFARFNDAVVLLTRMASPTFYAGAPIIADVEVSNFGREIIAGKPLFWTLQERSGEIVLRGQVDVPSAPTGTNTPLCRLEIPTDADGKAHAWELILQLGDCENSWHVWSFPYPQHEEYRDVGSRLNGLRNVFPGADYSDDYMGSFLKIDRPVDEPDPDSPKLAISDRLSMRLLQYLVDGGRVWLMPDAKQLYDAVPTRYLPPFWSYLHFPDNVSSVMGMIIHPHPALGSFPHDGYSDWQWYKLVNETPAICLDSIPSVKPIIEVVDNFNRAKRLCYAFEVRVGNGRLFVSTLCLHNSGVAGRPEARFLMNEIVHYLCGETFAPAEKLSVGEVLGLFRLTNRLQPIFD